MLCNYGIFNAERPSFSIEDIELPDKGPRVRVYTPNAVTDTNQLPIGL
jgi:hypothetical protein